MRRKTTKELIKRNLAGIALSGFLILAGVFLLFLSKLPVASYEDCLEKTVTVDSISYHYGYRSSGYWELRTENGESYNLTGSFDRSEMKESLTHGVEAQIRYWELRTEDGESYNLTGSFDRSEMKESLTHGVEAQIRYWENWLGNLFGHKYAEEVVVNGKRIVSYNNDEDQHLTALYLLSGACILFGAAGLFLFRWEVRRNRELQRKRDQRIEKKYGKKQGK